MADTTFAGVSAWMVWPALGLLIAGSFIPLLLEMGVFARAFRDLASFVFRPLGLGGVVPGRVLRRAAYASARCCPGLASLGVIVVVGRLAFGIHPAVTVGAP